MKMSKYRKPFLFALSLIPVAVVGGIFTGMYQVRLFPEETINELISQVGSLKNLYIITAVQSVGYALFCGFFGYILSGKCGLMKSLSISGGFLKKTLLISVTGGIIISLDYWTFGALYPEIREATMAGVNLISLIASVTYGGVLEEIMLRLFCMSFIAWVIKKLFFRKSEEMPGGVILTANIIASLLFAAGHLPATVVTFGSLNAILLIRCFLLNGGFGFLSGYLYEKYGIQYSIISHAVFHIVSKAIWFLFV